MAQLIEALHRAGKSSGFGFSRGTAPAAKPRSAAIVAATKGGADAEALVKTGVDALIIGAEDAASFSSTTTWGVDLRGQENLTIDRLKALHEGGAGFAILGTDAPARAFAGKVEQFDRVLAIVPPADDPLLLKLRALNLLDVDLAIFDTQFTARELSQLTAEAFAELRAMRETLRFPTIITLREVPAEADIPLLVKFGAQGIWLASATPAEVTRLREGLERVPRETDDGPPAMGQSTAAAAKLSETGE